MKTGIVANINFYEVKIGYREHVLTVHHSNNGIPEKVGKDLVNFLAQRRIIEECGDNEKALSVHRLTAALGTECLIAQYIACFKRTIGELYVYKAFNNVEEYTYNVYVDLSEVNNYRIKVEVYNYSKLIFEGNATEMLEWIRKSMSHAGI